jgi:hypothetical protein
VISLGRNRSSSATQLAFLDSGNGHVIVDPNAFARIAYREKSGSLLSDAVLERWGELMLSDEWRW